MRRSWSERGTRRLLAVLTLCVAVAAPGAWACPEDGDADGVCDAVDNCPADANPAQADLDGDTQGDVCDPEDAATNVTRVLLKGQSSDLDNSALKVKGDFFAIAAGDDVTIDAGLSLHVQDPIGVDVTIAWSPTECVDKGAKIVCRGDDEQKRKLIVKRATTEPTFFRITAKARRLGLSAPFDSPVTVTLSHGAVDRVGHVTDCRLRNVKLNCREF